MSELRLNTDGHIIKFGADNDINITHVADTGLTTNGTFQATTITATTAVVPDASDGAALGTTALEWSDLFLADGAVINFGDDQDVSLTHVADAGLLLNSTMKLQFNDASQFVQGSSATVLSIGATDEIDLTATAIDINGTCDISGTFSLAGTAVTSTAAELNILDGNRSTIVSASYDISTANGNLAITGAGFAPDRVIVFQTISNTPKWSFGMGTKSDNDFQTTVNNYLNNADNAADEGHLVSIYTSANPDRAQGSIGSWDSDGITLAWTKTGSPTGTAVMNFMFFK